MKKKLIAVNNIFVNGFTFNKGRIIEFKEGDGTTPSGYYTSDGIEVPSYIDITNKLNFVPFAPKFKIGDYVHVTCDNNMLQFMPFSLTHFQNKVFVVSKVTVRDCGNIEYKIVLADHEHKNYKDVNRIYKTSFSEHYKEFVKATIPYWYVNCNGEIERGFTGVDNKSFEWLRLSGNLFWSEKEVINFKANIMKNGKNVKKRF